MKTTAQMLAEVLIIVNETNAGANTKNRIGALFQDIIESLVVTPVTLTDQATITPDFASQQQGHFKITLGGNRNIANPLNPVVGGFYLFEIVQDGTGSRTITSWGSLFKFPGDVNPILTTTPGRRDFVGFICNSVGQLDGNAILNFA